MFNFKEKKVKVFDSVEEVEDLLKGKEKALMRGKWSGYFVFKHEEDYYLIKNKCPHQNKPLYEGYCENEKWVCPWHQYHFDLKKGRGHGTYLETHPLTLIDESLYFTKTVFNIF